jgi:hypothetical protein
MVGRAALAAGFNTPPRAAVLHFLLITDHFSGRVEKLGAAAPAFLYQTWDFLHIITNAAMAGQSSLLPKPIYDHKTENRKQKTEKIPIRGAL